MAIRQQQSVVSSSLLRYRICKEMGWDFYTYEAQPPFFIDEILIFMKQEGEKAKADSQKSNANIKTAPSTKGISRYG